MKIGEKVQVIRLIKSPAILIDGALLTPRVFEYYKKQLTAKQLAQLKYETVEIVYRDYNDVVSSIHDINGDDHERNEFQMPNGETYHN